MQFVKWPLISMSLVEDSSFFNVQKNAILLNLFIDQIIMVQSLVPPLKLQILKEICIKETKSSVFDQSFSCTFCLF